MTSASPRVLLVDDEPGFRAQLRAVLADYGVVVAAEAGSGLEGWSWPAGCARTWC